MLSPRKTRGEERLSLIVKGRAPTTWFPWKQHRGECRTAVRGMVYGPPGSGDSQHVGFAQGIEGILDAVTEKLMEGLKGCSQASCAEVTYCGEDCESGNFWVLGGGIKPVIE